MRLFTAVDISEEVRGRLARFLDQHRPLANLRWSPAENLHITTKFIGERKDGELKPFLQALGEASQLQLGTLRIQIQGLGWYPNPHRPRVFWAGVHTSENLKTLAANTSRALEALGVAAETREFSPHLTLARTRENTSNEALNSVRRVVAALESDDFGTFDADGQCLYLSAGGEYTKVARFSFKQDGN